VDRERPLLVTVHSGPNAQAIVDWDERVQHFVVRGWTVLAPNHRGSTGYGRAYTQALAGAWGVVDVADTVSGIRAAVAEGWATPRRSAVIGGSAGGFTALLAAAAAPDLVGAVVASYPVTNLLALAAHTHRFERHALDRHVGALPGAEAEYRARSPIARVDAIRAPVLILQGDADVVVSASDTSAFVDALRARNRDVEYHVYPGVGHGWSDPAIAADARRRTERFVAERLGRP
jgi:dipeptidyl aminopeptidase/acylaminoacyl peptidase